MHNRSKTYQDSNNLSLVLGEMLYLTIVKFYIVVL
jgi:hypothetical protein